MSFRRFSVVTSCSKKGWDDYGRNMAVSFHKLWPEEVDLIVYSEDADEIAFDMSDSLFEAVQIADVYIRCPWLKEFHEKHKDNIRARGIVGTVYDFRYDAVRFSYKIAAYTDVGLSANNCDVLIWMDADAITHSQVTMPWLENLLPRDADMAWLYRTHQYPECGFLMFDLMDGDMREVFMYLQQLFKTSDVLKMSEQHDSWLLQEVVKAQQSRGLRVASLSGGFESTGHPFINGPLGACLDHMKGEKRKKVGRSMVSDLARPRNEPYWRAQ